MESCHVCKNISTNLMGDLNMEELTADNATLEIIKEEKMGYTISDRAKKLPSASLW